MSKELHNLVLQAVARGWTYPKTSSKDMDTDLAEAISLEIMPLFAEAEQREKRLREALEQIVEEGNKPSDSGAVEDGLSPCWIEMQTIAEQALKETDNGNS